jgi:hypothetical protein
MNAYKISIALVLTLLIAFAGAMANDCGPGGVCAPGVNCKPCPPGSCSTSGNTINKADASLINASAEPAGMTTGATCDISQGCAPSPGCCGSSGTSMAVVGLLNTETGEIKYVTMPVSEVQRLVSSKASQAPNNAVEKKKSDI